MMLFRSALSILLTAWLGVGCVSRLPQAPPASTRHGEFRQIAFGLCEDYPEESRSLEAARRDLQVVATNGSPVLRIAFGWDAMEPEPGKYDWSFWDEFVRMATDEYRVRLIPYICYTPRWASSSQEDDFWQHPPRNNEDFARFVRAIAGRYRDRIRSWELWNEPDNPAYWAGNVEQFAGLLAAGSRAVRETDPNAQVVFGGLAWDLNFLEAVLTNQAAMRHVDVVNLHNYFETWSSEPLEYLADYVGRAHDILRRHGYEQPLWMAEVGYSSFRRGARVSGQYEARYRHEHTEQFQAAALFRVMTMLAASGKVSLVAWYRINDLPATQEVIGDVNNRHLGVLNRNGKPKPAMRALNFFESLLGGGFRCIDGEVRIAAPIMPQVVSHAFELPDGRVVVVAWLQNHVPGGWEADGGTAEDQRRATVRVQVPVGEGGSAALFDEEGNRIGSARLRSTGGVRSFELKLRGGRTGIAVISGQRNGSR